MLDRCADEWINTERTLHDLCITTSALSNPEIAPVLKGNCKMQGPDNEANSDLLTHTASSQITKEFSSHRDRSQQKFEYRGKSGACNVCSAPCSSCFHLNKVVMNSTDESAGEICAENIVVDHGKQLKTAKLSEMNTVSGLHSSSDCFSENAVGKASSKTFDAYASDDNVVHSKFEDRRVLDGQDDCLSCVGGADELANRESDNEIGRIKCSSTTQSKTSGESSDKVFSSSSQIGLNSQNLGSVKIPSSEVTNDRPLMSSPNKEVALDDVCAEATAMAQKPIKESGDLEVGIQPTDETDESDMVEHDVKVCDICGDAGREELLAICCLCSDGAEHTYCMREMRDEVPEGDWLCEECRSTEQVRNERQEKIDGYEKNRSSGQASGENVNSSEVEGPRTKGYLKINGRRLRDDADAEVSSIVKKPAVESSVKSPKPSNSSRTATLSRELSLKNLDKNSLQPQLHSSSETIQVNSTPDSEIIASDIRVKDALGTFSKSNSFNSLSSKPKVKLVDQVVLQRQKSAREHSSFRLKESVGRSIGKSISFTSSNSGRAESKTETLSPRLSFIRDSRITKRRSSVERQSSFRKEPPSIKSATNTSLSSISRIEKKLASKDVSSSLTSITNHHEAKPVRTDGIGAFKRPSPHGHTAVSVSSASGDNSEQKHNQINPKEDLTPRSVAEKAPFNTNEGLHDGLSRPKGSSNSGGRVSGARFRPLDSKSSVGENDTLKAAIEAAVLRKPELYRKHRPLGQSDNSSMSTVGCEITSSQERVSKFAGKKQFSVSAELPDGVLLLDGKNFSRDMFSNVPEAMPFFLKSLAVPEHEYIWQGSFEICRRGNVVDLWDGLQAHLSTLASPKVNEAVNKFNNRIVLYEVPRLSTWPVQFQENGVREDNIGIFFFAKDLESYDKIYKVLLDNMMKNDLALKGDVNGVELLIFPSNQLPDNVQRWNMLFFLWAVFREKKESCLQPMPESIKQVSSPQDIPPAIMSLSESRIAAIPVAKVLASSDDTAPVHKVPAAGKLWSLLSSRTVNQDRVTKLPSLDRLNSKLNSSSSAASDDGKQCQEPRGTYLEGGISPRYGSHLQVMGTAGGSVMDQMPINLDTPLDRQQSSHPSNNKAAATCDMAAERRILEIALDMRTSNQDVLHNGNNADDLLRNGETPLREDRDTIDLNMECVEPPYTSQVLAGPDVACNELCLAFEKVNHEATGSHIPENLHNEACDKMDILMYKENGERRIFLTESQPLVSALWKTSPLEEDRLFDRAPSLELALGAESKPMSFLSIQPLLMDKKVNDEHVPDEVGTIADDDMSASLSLSLSFPFPEKDHSTKPARINASESERVNNPMLLFGGLKRQ